MRWVIVNPMGSPRGWAPAARAPNLLARRVSAWAGHGAREVRDLWSPEAVRRSLVIRMGRRH